MEPKAKRITEYTSKPEFLLALSRLSSTFLFESCGYKMIRAERDAEVRKMVADWENSAAKKVSTLRPAAAVNDWATKTDWNRYSRR